MILRRDVEPEVVFFGSKETEGRLNYGTYNCKSNCN